MFYHDRRLQYHATPDRPDPLFAKKLQEVLGGQWGEMTVMMQYMFQGCNCRGPAKYRDMIMDIATEEMAHVEMLATMIAQLLEGASVEDQEKAARDSLIGAVMGGSSAQDVMLSAAMNPQHLIVTGQGAAPTDSVGYPWTSRYTISSGNLLADFRANVTAESQGRLQVCRLYELTEDSGVRDMLSFLIARDAMHQNQWLAAIEELEADGLESSPCPSDFPADQQLEDVANQFLNCSRGTESESGRWAHGRTPDGRSEFEYVTEPQPLADEPHIGDANPRLHGTPHDGRAA